SVNHGVAIRRLGDVMAKKKRTNVKAKASMMPTGPTIARTIPVLNRLLAPFRRKGDTIALVPTMGALHSGHLELVRQAKKRARRVVVSVFVNPAQFAPHEDFGSYPRTFAADVKALAAEGV